MRRILVDQARRKQRVKYGGELHRATMPEISSQEPDGILVALDEALIRLATEDPEAAKVVELHHFAGVGHEETAAALGITVYRARQKWSYARAWLRDAIATD